MPIRPSILFGTFLLSACAVSLPPKAPKIVTLADYKKIVEDEIEPIWDSEIQWHGDLARVGTVTITFRIPAAGGVPRNVRVTAGRNNPRDLALAVAAIGKVSAPPVPAHLLDRKQNYLTLEESFTIRQ